MLIAHLPAGYLIAKSKQHWVAPITRIEFAACLIGSVIPDIDMVWFWTIDHRQHHHHGYFTHWPIFWIFVWLLGLAISKARPQLFSQSAANMFGLGAFSHMVLDSVAAPIMWFAPFSYRWIEMVHVPTSPHGATYALVTHWTFGLELAICFAACCTLAASRWGWRNSYTR
jgi:inner membrane protein